MSEERLGLDELAALDPGPVRDLADHLGGAVRGLELVAGLIPSSTQGWRGAGADAGFIALGVRRAVVGAARETFAACAAALDAHAGVIEEVRARARWLAVDRGDLDRYDAEPLSAGIVAQERARLAARASALAEELGASASAAEAVVGRAAADAPAGPALEERVTDALASIGAGVALGLEGVAVTAWTLVRLTPAYAQDDPEGSARTRAQVRAAFEGALEHPVDTALAVLDVETAVDDPLMWLGKIAPGLALTVATGGVGSVGGVAAVGARGAGAGSRVQKVVGGAVDQGVSVAGSSGAAGAVGAVGAAAQDRGAGARAASPGYRTPGNPMAPEAPAAEGSRRREQLRAARGGATRAIVVPRGGPADPPTAPTVLTDEPAEPSAEPSGGGPACAGR